MARYSKNLSAEDCHAEDEERIQLLTKQDNVASPSVANNDDLADKQGMLPQEQILHPVVSGLQLRRRFIAVLLMVGVVPCTVVPSEAMSRICTYPRSIRLLKCQLFHLPFLATRGTLITCLGLYAHVDYCNEQLPAAHYNPRHLALK
ncbi:hypothetical protein BDF19DRAFT_426172 [Syncephalis fuscata]|nr:hypothetical protein BDF19DRAFT_426172 [Syncephalis fuscata]